MPIEDLLRPIGQPRQLSLDQLAEPIPRSVDDLAQPLPDRNPMSITRSEIDKLPNRIDVDRASFQAGGSFEQVDLERALEDLDRGRLQTVFSNVMRGLQAPAPAIGSLVDAFNRFALGVETQLGEELSYAIDTSYRTNPVLDDSFLYGAVPQAAGSILGMLIPSIASMQVASYWGYGLRGAKLAGALTGSLEGMALGAATAYEQGKAVEASGEDIAKAMALNGVIGASDAIPLGRILHRFGAAGRVLDIMGRTKVPGASKIPQALRSAILQGVIEGSQQLLQSNGEAYVMNQVYGLGRELGIDPFKKEAAAAGLVGFVLDGLVSYYTGRSTQAINKIREIAAVEEAKKQTDLQLPLDKPVNVDGDTRDAAIAKISKTTTDPAELVSVGKAVEPKLQGSSDTEVPAPLVDPETGDAVDGVSERIALGKRLYREIVGVDSIKDPVPGFKPYKIEFLESLLKEKMTSSDWWRDRLNISHRWVRSGMPLVGEALRTFQARINAELLVGQKMIKDTREILKGNDFARAVAATLSSRKDGAAGLRKWVGKLSEKDMLRLVVDEKARAEFVKDTGVPVKSINELKRLMRLTPEELDGIDEIAKRTAKMFKSYKTKLKKAGIEVDFIGDIRNRMEGALERAIEKGDDAKAEALRRDLEALENIDFTHIPVRVLTLQQIQKRLELPGTSYKPIADMLRNRKHITLTEFLYNSNDISLSDLRYSDMIMSYTRMVGEVLARQNIIKAGKAYGLIFDKEGPEVTAEKKRVQQAIRSRRRKEKKLGLQLPADPKEERFITARDVAPGTPKGVRYLSGTKLGKQYKDYLIHYSLVEMIKQVENLQGLPKGAFGRQMSRIKSMAFTRPELLAMYNIIQSSMVGIVNPVKAVKNAKTLAKATDMVLNYDKEYQLATQYGFASQPVVEPFWSSIEMGRWLEKTWSERGADYLKEFTKAENYNPLKAFPLLDAAYAPLHMVAWKLDEIVRFSTYLNLRERGANRPRAAQLTALIHGDYASVPPDTRAKLNKVFFTPTFKVVMARAQARMLDAFVRRYTPGVKYKKTLESDIMSRGIVGMIAIQGGFDLFMTRFLGFEREEFGRKYTREMEVYDDKLDQVVNKELVVTWSNPANMFAKYARKLAKSITVPGKQTAMKQFLQETKYEFHPLWQSVYNLINNNNGVGGQIYYPLDHTMVKGLKSINYMVFNLIPILDVADRMVGSPVASLTSLTDSQSEVQGRKMFRDYVGFTGSIFADLLTMFRYSRDPAVLRHKAKINTIQRIIMDELKARAERGQPVNEDNLKRGLKMIEDILREVEESRADELDSLDIMNPLLWDQYLDRDNRGQKQDSVLIPQ